MNTQKALTILSCLIVALSLVAAGTGLLTSTLWQSGEQFEFITLRGQAVDMQGIGLYKLDSVAGASQEIGQDIVTLLIGIPLLVAATVGAARGFVRAKVLRAGTLGYFLYTYTAMSMLTAYNELFLLYVALMSLNLFSFVLAILEIDVASLPGHFSEKFPRRTVAGFTFFVGAMLAVLWLGLLVPPLLAGTTPAGLDSYTTMVIQAMDLGFIVPAAVLAGALLLRRSAVGYLLSSVVLVKGFTMGAALLAMNVAQILAGVRVDPIVAIAFTALAVADMVLTIVMLRSIRETPASPEEAAQAAPPTVRAALSPR
jgi:hypothetical protein